ncbi:MAG: hypothetical protein CMJ83_16415 [Planctomycetes bacterium]|jgi:nucleoside phosphorylase|nr:hypothetical protein [Planctomycetota bacterium]
MDDRPLFIAAIEEEIAPLRRRLASANDPREVTVVGDGAVRAARGLARELDARSEPPAAIVVVGFAGALATDLVVGTVTTAVTVREGRSAVLVPDPEWRARAEAAGASPCTLISAPRLIATPEDRRTLRAAHHPPPEVVDLETAALIGVSVERGLPWCVLRAITDAASDALPTSLVRAEREDGSINRGRVVRGALLRPWTIPSLWDLRHRARTAAAALAETALRL